MRDGHVRNVIPDEAEAVPEVQLQSAISSTKLGACIGAAASEPGLDRSL
jgi:hypothetical protein